MNACLPAYRVTGNMDDADDRDDMGTDYTSACRRRDDKDELDWIYAGFVNAGSMHKRCFAIYSFIALGHVQGSHGKNRVICVIRFPLPAVFLILINGCLCHYSETLPTGSIKENGNIFSCSLLSNSRGNYLSIVIAVHCSYHCGFTIGLSIGPAVKLQTIRISKLQTGHTG